MYIKIVTTFIFAYWQIYWWVTERQANRKKSKTQPRTWKSKVRYAIARIFPILIFFQLFGIIVVEFPRNIPLQIVGLLLVILGVFTSISARKTLSHNWTHAAEYQIKKDHELVTKGVYRYIRHPIYAGLLVAYTGAELILQSYLFIIVFLVIFLLIYIQGKQEEKILLKHFGKKYEEYMKKTKMLFPYVL